MNNLKFEENLSPYGLMELLKSTQVLLRQEEF
ncbi:hypothetical protein Gohar_017138 [Gossypium harknessii]|uniref:Uncharacterized protein n=1 Tax=Gossypium harknessii TaxID=34285 RepID=A0A7J9G4X7_9ROSI|nr:hypothetical protein [Gossypium harknessii]